MNLGQRDQSVVTDEARARLLAAAELALEEEALEQERMEQLFELILGALDELRTTSDVGARAHVAVIRRQLARWSERRAAKQAAVSAAVGEP